MSSSELLWREVLPNFYGKTPTTFILWIENLLLFLGGYKAILAVERAPLLAIMYIIASVLLVAL